MTAQEIADRVRTQEITLTRVKKLEQLVARSKVELSAVLALLPAEVQAQIKALK